MRTFKACDRQFDKSRATSTDSFGELLRQTQPPLQVANAMCAERKQSSKQSSTICARRSKSRRTGKGAVHMLCRTCESHFSCACFSTTLPMLREYNEDKRKRLQDVRAEFDANWYYRH